MITMEELKYIKYIINQLEVDCGEWYSDDDEDIDYEDLKKRIYNEQTKIKSIVELWEE